MEAGYVDEEYENRMISFEIDCQDGKGAPEACHHVGDFMAIVKNDKLRASKVYELNCEENKHLPSCFNLARLFAAGKGVEKNQPRAQTLFETSCTGGILPACYFYGAMLVSGPQNSQEVKQKGLDLLVETCRKGEVESCNSVGSWYLNPTNPNRNPILAEEMLKIACKECYAPACHNLAVMYRKGDTNIPLDMKLHEDYKKKTLSLMDERKEMNKVLKKG